MRPFNEEDLKWELKEEFDPKMNIFSVYILNFSKFHSTQECDYIYLVIDFIFLVSEYTKMKNETFFFNHPMNSL